MNRSKIVSVRMTDAQKEKLDRYTEAYGVSISTLIVSKFIDRLPEYPQPMELPSIPS